MGKEEDNGKQKERKNMALLAKPNNKAIIIDSTKSQKFLEDSKKSIIRPEFLRECQKYHKLLNQK